MRCIFKNLCDNKVQLEVSDMIEILELHARTTYSQTPSNRPSPSQVVAMTMMMMVIGVAVVVVLLPDPCFP